MVIFKKDSTLSEIMTNGLVNKALSSLGKGFDLSSDFRIEYCKGKNRLVLLNEDDKRELIVPGCGVAQDISIDINCDKGDQTRYQSDIIEFHQMSQLFNQMSSVQGKIPSGFFSSMFGFEGSSWGEDASSTKKLGMDSQFIILSNLRIERYPLVLSDDVRNAVPSTWDPSAIARFIENYGTHIIVGLSIGGADMVLVRQDKGSKMSAVDVRNRLNELGFQLFEGACKLSPRRREQKVKLPRMPCVFDQQSIAIKSHSTICYKDGLHEIHYRKGGERVGSHCEWLRTVASKPDVIHYSFIPIISLLNGVPGKGFLSHAINLYLRYKPPLTDLRNFLEFHTHKFWAPIHNELPLGPTGNMASSLPRLRFGFMAPKIFVNTTQVKVGKRPVTGMRLYLEGKNCNRLAIHLQHLAIGPEELEKRMTDETHLWSSSESDTNHQKFIEPVGGKRFSHICTAPVMYNPDWAAPETKEAFIVTGVQLYVKKYGSKNILHLRLLFSKVSNAFVVRSSWKGSAGVSQKSGMFAAFTTSMTGKPENNEKAVVDSGVYPDGPPVPTLVQKMLKHVDTSQIVRGPQDTPGHWLVTGAKLDGEKGKICLHVEFSLLA